MRHIDPADLAERALDESVSPLAPWEDKHLHRCPACARQLEAFRRVVSAARSVTAEDVPVPAPRRVWDALIADMTAEAQQEGKSLHTGERAPVALPALRRLRQRTGRPRSSRPWAAVVAVVCLVFGASAGSSLTWWEMQPSHASVGAGQPLTSPKAGDTRGNVRLLRDGEVNRVRVTVHGLPSTAGYYEVWLMDDTHKKLIPLGALGSGGSSTLTLPPDVDTDVYALLDISAQRYDGTTAHSGISVVRGPLPSLTPGGAADV